MGRRLRDTDWKAIGYGVSSLSVLALGAAAWPHAEQQPWHMPALILGMLLSVLGMAFRYLSHRIDQQKIREAKQQSASS